MASSVTTTSLTGYLITSGICPFIEIREKQLRIFANGDVMGLGPYVAIGQPQEVQVPRKPIDNIISHLREMDEIREKRLEIAKLAMTIFDCTPLVPCSHNDYVDAIRLKPQASSPEEALLDITEIFIPTLHMRVWSNGTIVHAQTHSRPSPHANASAHYSPFVRCFWSCIPLLGYRPELRMIQESLEVSPPEKIKVPLRLAQRIRGAYKELHILRVQQMTLISRISEAAKAIFPE